MFYYNVNMHVPEGTVAQQQLLLEKMVWRWEDRTDIVGEDYILFLEKPVQ